MRYLPHVRYLPHTVSPLIGIFPIRNSPHMVSPTSDFLCKMIFKTFSSSCKMSPYGGVSLRAHLSGKVSPSKHISPGRYLPQCISLQEGIPLRACLFGKVSPSGYISTVRCLPQSMPLPEDVPAATKLQI